MSNVVEIVKRCLSFDDEQEWFDFKDNWFEIDEIGQYISALSNAAVMAGESSGGVKHSCRTYCTYRV